jgi:hypothetical protein
MREHAVDAARCGFRVFKLQVESKFPAIERFYEVASDDPLRVFEMWTCPVSGEALDNNIGILTGGQLMVLDVDVRDGKPGMDSLRTLEASGALPRGGIRSRTASGGIHIYLKVPHEVPNSGGRIAPGIDIRGYHGYVVAPGSVVGGKQYRWIRKPAFAKGRANG